MKTRVCSRCRRERSVKHLPIGRIYCTSCRFDMNEKVQASRPVVEVNDDYGSYDESEDREFVKSLKLPNH